YAVGQKLTIFSANVRLQRWHPVSTPERLFGAVFIYLFNTAVRNCNVALPPLVSIKIIAADPLLAPSRAARWLSSSHLLGIVTATFFRCTGNLHSPSVLQAI